MPIEQIEIGVAASALASALNFAVARVLLRAGRNHRSIALEADARHLMTDVWTSAGVILGVVAVSLTGWMRLDPIIALAVAVNIVWTGVQLLRRSVGGLMDAAVSPTEQGAIKRVLRKYEDRGIGYHALRTRQAGTRTFISLHVLVPADWTVQRGHDLLEDLEADIRSAVPGAHVSTHLEPLGDPAAWRDIELDR
jgi:cation diffusion facilitator family transporter